jgi:mono/diheme cytochrome c family protein
MTKRLTLSIAAGLALLWVCGSSHGTIAGQQPANASSGSAATRATLDQYCAGCHNDKLKTAGVSFNALNLDKVGADAEIWEKAVRKLRGRMMPPAGQPRPGEDAYNAAVAYLERSLDAAAAANPNPGRTETFRRVTRTEYQNAIRDLLALDVDVAALLPKDDASFGFDNNGSSGFSPTLLERYLSAAQKISKLAMGTPGKSVAVSVVTMPVDLTQEGHLDGLPFGTRGGSLVQYAFPRDGEYEIQVRLMRNRNENVEGLTEPHQMELTLDGERLRVFTIVPNRNASGGYYADEAVDRDLKLRMPVKAGLHTIAATFLRKTSALIESERQPYEAHFNMDRHPRIQPAVYSVSIGGPFDGGTTGDTPSRKRILVCKPAPAPSTAGRLAAEDRCASTILSSLARRAYRRPVAAEDIRVPLSFFKEGRAEGGFDGGVEMAVRAILTSPEFLFRVERDPATARPNSNYRISDLELASRLSFFLWSSIPDDELLNLAAQNKLRDAATLRRQVGRMMADPKARALVTNFAGQWLYLRNLTTAFPDARLFPDFDDNVRQAMRQETELFFESVVKEDRSVKDLLGANYTFLNERLARHYGIPNVYGSHFRRVTLDDSSMRGGLLGQGSILTVTSYGNRTSPVLRGKWVLENLLSTPPPVPPPNVPPLGENPAVGKALTMRERMEEHRANPACASCHRLMDPIGLSVEHFDAVGRWRSRGEGDAVIDAAGALPSGVTFEGSDGLKKALLARPDMFATTVTEKLFAYAMGRGIGPAEAPAIRRIVRNAATQDYKFSSLLLGVIESTPFQMRRSQ